nr:MAG: hypothetical protein [Prevotella phage R001]DAJ81647.1 MAG TPA: hypothetical protein [Crassvirales sp.]
MPCIELNINRDRLIRLYMKIQQRAKEPYL